MKQPPAPSIVPCKTCSLDPLPALLPFSGQAPSSQCLSCSEGPKTEHSIWGAASPVQSRGARSPPYSCWPHYCWHKPGCCWLAWPPGHTAGSTLFLCSGSNVGWTALRASLWVPWCCPSQFKATRSCFGLCVWVCIQTLNCIQISLVSEDSLFLTTSVWQASSYKKGSSSLQTAPKLPVPSPLWSPRLAAASGKLMPGQLVQRCMLKLCWLGPLLQICSTPVPPRLLSVCCWLFTVSESSWI